MGNCGHVTSKRERVREHAPGDLLRQLRYDLIIYCIRYVEEDCDLVYVLMEGIQSHNEVIILVIM